jgi:hypothetical protein
MTTSSLIHLSQEFLHGFLATLWAYNNRTESRGVAR